MTSALDKATQPTFSASLQYTALSFRLRTDERYLAQTFRLATDLHVIRNLHVGLDFPWVVLPQTSLGHAQAVVGQPAIWIRAFRSLEQGRYLLGAGLAVLPPMVRFDDLDEHSRAQRGAPANTFAALMPADLSAFADRRWTLRPFIDLQAESRYFWVRWRATLEINAGGFGDILVEPGTTTNTPTVGSGRVLLASVASLAFGVRPTPLVTVGVEATEVYLVRTTFALSDAARAVFVLSPTLRFQLPWIQPSIGLVIPVGPALLQGHNGAFGVQLTISTQLGKFT